MTTTAPSIEASAAPALTGYAGFLRAPADGATWRGLAQLALGWVWLLTAGLAVWVCVAVSLSLVPVLGVGLPLLALSLLLARGFAAAERARLAATTGVVVPAPPRPAADRPGWWPAMWALLRDTRTWAAVAYDVLALLLVTVAGWLTVALGAAALAAAAFPLYGEGTDLAARFDPPWPVVAAGALGAAVVLAWATALAAQYGTFLTVRLATALLGPSAAVEARERARAAEGAARAAEATAHGAQERAAVLAQTRAAALEAADAERRRIERDLHDGAQQRLVALGVDLGVSRRAADRDPAAAVAALEHAHDEVKATLAELRDLVRGIHPAVLTDRGLDAALSALAARSPVPVRVDVAGDLAAAGPPAQAAAYFVVAEALTNVAKHADAEQVRVTAAVVPAADGTPGAGRLRVVVADDGRGGAVPAAGSGLAGLRGRVGALDGTFDLDSPTGGGTRLTVEVPCAS